MVDPVPRGLTGRPTCCVREEAEDRFARGPDADGAIEAVGACHGISFEVRIG